MFLYVKLSSRSAKRFWRYCENLEYDKVQPKSIEYFMLFMYMCVFYVTDCGNGKRILYYHFNPNVQLEDEQ